MHMGSHDLEFFVHTQGAKPVVVTASSGEILRDALLRAGIITAADAGEILIFVGECDEALREADDIEVGADEHAPVDPNLTLDELGVHAHHHVHCHRCRHVAVEVNFGGQTKQRRFSPATTIAVVTEWARKKFHLDPAAASEYVLQICQSTEQPRADRHLGELVRGAAVRDLLRPGEGSHAAGLTTWRGPTSVSSKTTSARRSSAAALSGAVGASRSASCCPPIWHGRR